jgi:hypothetical protein
MMTDLRPKILEGTKMKRNWKRITGIAALGALGALGPAACEKQKSGDAAAANSQEQGLAAVIVKAEPDNAITVIKARDTAKPGNLITVTGKISGSRSPFTEGFASFVLSDDALETCDEIPGDSCKTPWDACCESPAKINAMRISVQVLGANGRPVAQEIKGIGGLKELDKVTLVGTVDESSTKENLIVNATKIYRNDP